MARPLPEGLLKNRDDATASVERSVDRARPEQIAHFWKIYSSKKAVLPENIGRRLENFFWRIWGSERIQHRLTGHQISVHFSIINQGGHIRTTPTTSPRSSKNLNTYYREISLRAPLTTPPTTPPSSGISSGSTSSSTARPPSSFQDPDNSFLASTGPGPLAVNLDPSKARQASSNEDPEASSLTPTPINPLASIERTGDSSKENRRASSSTTTRKPPILKKEGSSTSSRSNKTAKVVSPSSGEARFGTFMGNEDAVPSDNDASLSASLRPGLGRRSATTRFNEEVAVSIPKPLRAVASGSSERLARSYGESLQRSGRRNPVVVASTGTGKRRPMVKRQKSSAGASKEGPSRSSSAQNLPRTPRSLSSSVAPGLPSNAKLGRSPEVPPTRRRRAASPYPSKQRQPPLRDPFLDDEVSEPADQALDETHRPSMQPSVTAAINRDTSQNGSGQQRRASAPFVEPDLRAAFVDKRQRSLRSLTDLSAFSRKSSAVVPTAASENVTGTIGAFQAKTSRWGGNSKQAFTNVTAPLKAPAPAGPEVTRGVTGDVLPKTKSQLLLLFKKDNERSAKEIERKSKKTDPGT